ncbi:alpha/beta fold hydrolase [Leifsonia sp. 2MCAF36]|uniref:alpha/beta fold hydrolase n=1 Tax=Leifsonia sp. 2MCAF36 TaxID=3232988 RepID=UPI003F9A0C40
MYYEVSGPEWGTPLVMVHGLGCQLVQWHPGLVLAFESAGYRVIRLDNRDAGLTQWTRPVPDAYEIGDFAGDVKELLDYLRIERAHFVGISMGGMITQEFAISFADRIASQLLLCTMSSVEFWTDDPEVLASRVLPAEAPMDRESVIERYLYQETFAGVTGFTEDSRRRFAEEQYDRAYRPDGTARQAAALEGYGDRRGALASVKIPTAIFHGRDDRLISYRAALSTGEILPNADLHLASHVGHELPPALWGDFIKMVDRNVALSRSASRN